MSIKDIRGPKRGGETDPVTTLYCVGETRHSQSIAQREGAVLIHYTFPDLGVPDRFMMRFPCTLPTCNAFGTIALKPVEASSVTHLLEAGWEEARYEIVIDALPLPDGTSAEDTQLDIWRLSEKIPILTDQAILDGLQETRHTQGNC